MLKVFKSNLPIFEAQVKVPDRFEMVKTDMAVGKQAIDRFGFSAGKRCAITLKIRTKSYIRPFNLLLVRVGAHDHP